MENKRRKIVTVIMYNENYPDDYWEINDDDVTDKDEGEYDDNSVIS